MAVLDCSRPRLNICCAYQEGRNCKTVRAAYLIFNLSRNGLFAVTAFLLSTAAWANRGAFGSISSKKRQVLRSDKNVEGLDDEREARAEGGRRFQREGPITEKDLDMAMVVLVRGKKSSHLSRERRGQRDEAEVGSRMVSRRYLGDTPIWALRTISRTLHFF